MVWGPWNRRRATGKVAEGDSTSGRVSGESKMPITREFLDSRNRRWPAKLTFCPTRGKQRSARPGWRDRHRARWPAGRRLLELLVDAAERHQLLLTPPEIVTPERFPELLYEAKRPFADVLTQQLAWTEALRCSPRQRARIFPAFPTAGRRHAAVAGDWRNAAAIAPGAGGRGLDCAKVLQGAWSVEGFAEQAAGRHCASCSGCISTRSIGWSCGTCKRPARWPSKSARSRRISKLCLSPRSISTAHSGKCSIRCATRVAALIVAAAQIWRSDSTSTAAWSPLSGPRPSCRSPMSKSSASMGRPSRPRRSRDGSARSAAATGPMKSRSACPTKNWFPHIERQFGQCGVAGRWAIGKQSTETAPYRLLKIALSMPTRRRFRDLAAIVRHADVYEWLVKEGTGDRRQGTGGRGTGTGILERSTSYASERFPAQLDEERLAKDAKSAEVLAIYQTSRQLIGAAGGPPRPLAALGGADARRAGTFMEREELIAATEARPIFVRIARSDCLRRSTACAKCPASCSRRSMPGRPADGARLVGGRRHSAAG